MRGWLRAPSGPVAALSFLAYALPRSTVQKAAPTKRVARQIRGSGAPESMATARRQGGSQESRPKSAELPG
jgi:hypothetical protein